MISTNKLIKINHNNYNYIIIYNNYDYNYKYKRKKYIFRVLLNLYKFYISFKEIRFHLILFYFI